MTIINTLLKYPGSKWRIAYWIISHFPEHKVYCEPFFGSGAIFFSKKPVYIETINDLDGNVVNLFKVCSGSDKENNRTTVTIMQELDKLSNDTILLAATNRLDIIDKAVLRRFSIKHEVKPLNDNEKFEMLDAFLKDVGVDFSGTRIKTILS